MSAMEINMPDEPTLITASGTPVWIEGSGPTIIFIHGVLMDHRMWRRQVAGLTETHRVVRLDMLGHGGAPNPPGPRCLDDFVAQVHEVVGATDDGTRPVLVGFSMGGLVAQAYGIRFADTLRALVIMNAVYDRSDAERAAVIGRLELMETQGLESVVAPAMERWYAGVDVQAAAELIDEGFVWLRSGDPAGKIKAYRVFATEDPHTAGKLQAITCPTLVTTGDGDVGSTPAMSRRMAALIPEARLRILTDQRHMMPVLDADNVNQMLREFSLSVVWHRH